MYIAIQSTIAVVFTLYKIKLLLLLMSGTGRSEYQRRTRLYGFSRHLILSPKDNPIKHKHKFIVYIITTDYSRGLLHISHSQTGVTLRPIYTRRYSCGIPRGIAHLSNQRTFIYFCVTPERYRAVSRWIASRAIFLRYTAGQPSS